MTQENKEKLKEKIIEYMFGISIKEILETYDEISDLYDNGEINSTDFYTILEEMKIKLK